MSLIQQLKKGSMPLLILSILQEEPMYGYQIMQELKDRSQGFFIVTAASLYPALHKLESDHLVISHWEDGDGNRRRKYYTITERGEAKLGDHVSEWQMFVQNLFAFIPPSLREPEGGLA